ncbi:flagellar hook-length control protein FliK [Burkholderia pseudomultivorans]|uniref:Flagellar hook-length control protein n=1 Tax=Burkholderia pseudomultivorans TaxID=1207504 RepID=A0ABU2E637_9BURK|nr:flagellar hook-length control protein FliK [Burkholderia pseudomultivorans]MDR8730221.1 Flagellar hook-length control protein [Burkholderia pseudomultivorans]MDR8735372.1 Flagellar hook-length control protein [Burkholderia pseudomultivorans]MDR8741252.1 Flagellar hook-length control protein [Burkholderia pseudomultivorans]MDR8755338.1 Flagellar hook-length control protein [Burkholderia pseudomultivorans]MDR8777666.1 Flagellar hook-length control protein [Burkholderia pseudomultivorans]
MPSLSQLGALLDTAGSALKASRSAASSGTDAATSTAPAPFTQTLQQRVVTRHGQTDAGPASPPKHATSKPDDDKSPDDATTASSTATNPDAAALAAAAAVQAQLQTGSTPADAATQQAAQAGQPDATATVAPASAQDAAPGSSRDALHAALEKLTGNTGAIAMPATSGAAAPSASASTAAALPAKLPTFTHALADAKGALASQAQPQTTVQALQTDAAAQSGAHALTAAGDSAEPNTAATLAAAATAAAQANLPTSPATGAVAAANAHVLAPQVGSTDWTDALSQKVVFLSNAHQQSAELTLNPPDLGPLQVVLRVADNHAHALFVSQHAQVRDAVEAALPKLREAMEAGGLGLGSTTVSDGGFASQQQNAQQGYAGGQSSRRAGAGSSVADAPVDAAPSASAAATVSRAGLVDTFA